MAVQLEMKPGSLLQDEYVPIRDKLSPNAERGLRGDTITYNSRDNHAPINELTRRLSERRML
jgi:hypothetical protein